MSISVIKVSELEGNIRFDSEYYQPNYLELVQNLEKVHAKPLSEIATIKKRKFTPNAGQTFNYIEISEVNTETGRVNAIETSGEDAPSRAQYIVQAGDVIISSVRPNRNAVALITKNLEGFVCSSGFVVLRPKNLPPEFLFILLKTNFVRTLLNRQTTATMYPAVAETDLIDTPIIVPGEKIIEVIVDKVQKATQLQNDADNLYANAEHLLAAELDLDQLDLSESLFNIRRVSDVLTDSRIDAEHYRQKYYRVLQALEKIDAKEVVPLQEIVINLTNGHTPLHHDLDVGDIPFLTAEHVYDFWVDYDNARRIWREHHEIELKRTQLRENDILITIKGRVGNAAVVEGLSSNVNINQDVALLRLKPGIHPYYVTGFLNSSAGKALMEQIATGQINPFLGLGNLAKVHIPIFDEERMNAIGEDIRQLVNKGHQAKEEAKRLLVEAKSEVERLIEKGT